MTKAKTKKVDPSVTKPEAEITDVMVDLKLRINPDMLNFFGAVVTTRDSTSEPEAVLQLMSDAVASLALAATILGIEDYSRVIKAASDYGDRMAGLVEASVPEDREY